MMKQINLLLVISFVFFLSCTQNTEVKNNKKEAVVHELVDKNATAETQKLYENLKLLSPNKTLYGHQDDLAYGMGWENEKGRSDVKEVSGSYPAVFGWELGEIGNPENLDSVNFENMKVWIAEGYTMGSVIEVSWHMINPVNKSTAWDTTRAVYSILPGGENYDFFKSKLNLVGYFFKSLKGKNGEAIPIIFRPWHEHVGSWFWWGKGHRTEAEYKALWRFTVHYMRDSLNIHNLLYAYSPPGDKEYLEAYPGDEYVDILGMDLYFYGKETDKWAPYLTEKLSALTKLAKEKKKVAALTETGLETLWFTNWHTEVILKALHNINVQNISYMLTWRNRHAKHFYAPYVGHASAEDFIKFKNDTSIIFNDELPELYK